MDQPNQIGNPYYRVARWCAAIGAVLMIAAGCLVLALMQERFEGKAREGVLAIAIFAGIFGLAFFGSAIFFAILARTVRRFIHEIRTDRCLVHWRYTPEEWQAFQATESPLLQRDFLQVVVYPLLIGGPLALGLLAFTLPPGRDLWITLGITAGFVVLVIGIAYYIRVVRRRQWGRACLLDPPDSYLHLEFARANGEFLYFNSYSQRLVRAEILDRAPAAIELEISSPMPRGGTKVEVRRILVPSDANAQAGDVVAKLRTACRLA